MNSIRSELPLVVFTTLAPLCAGAWIVAAILVLSNAWPQSIILVTGLYGSILCALLIAALGCSILHLGKPLKALRAFMRLGNSTVSNEVFMGTLFTVFLIVFLLISQSMVVATIIWKVLLVAVTVLAALFIFFQCLAYRMRTIPTWNSTSFSLEFAVIALLGGMCVEVMLMCLALPVPYSIRLALVIAEAACCIVMVFVIYAQGISVARSVLSLRNAHTVLERWRVFSVTRALAIVVGSVLWGWGVLSSEPVLALVISGALLVVAGIAIGRYAYYRFYVNVGLPQI